VSHHESDASPEKYVYPSGFVVGEKVVFHDNGKRKYNKHIDIPDGTVLQVEENPNPPGQLWPSDAVQVRMCNGIGAVDAACLMRKPFLVKLDTPMHPFQKEAGSMASSATVSEIFAAIEEYVDAVVGYKMDTGESADGGMVSCIQKGAAQKRLREALLLLAGAPAEVVDPSQLWRKK
jgi:hypothetical protein